MRVHVAQKIIYWLVPLVLSLPLTSFRRRLIEDSVSVDWQVLLRIVPIGVLALYFFPKFLKLATRSSIDSLLVVWLFFISLRTVLIFTSMSPSLGLLQMYYLWTATIIIYGMAFLNLKNSDWVISFIQKFILSTVFMGAIASIIDSEMLWFHEYGASGEILKRYAGGLVHPFVISELGCVFIGISFFLKNWKVRIFNVILGVLLMALSMTKTWVVGALFGFLAIVWFKRIIKRPYFIILILLFVPILIGILEFTHLDLLDLSQYSRSGNANEIYTLTGRTQIWAVALELWKERFILGWGTGSSRWALLLHGSNMNHAHNLYLQALLEGGLILLASLIFVLMQYFKLILQTYKMKGADRDNSIFLIYLGICMLVASLATLPGFFSFGISFVCWCAVSTTVPCPNGVRRILRL